jgi:hypothetical protein
MHKPVTPFPHTGHDAKQERNTKGQVHDPGHSRRRRDEEYGEAGIQP